MLEFNFEPFPSLQTERLSLRRITEEDVNDIFTFRSNENVMRFIPRPVAKKPEDVLIVLEMVNNGIKNNQSINWAICKKEDNRLIGMIGYVRSNPVNHRAEVGYVLNGDFHRRGIVSEALQAVIRYGFNEMKLNCVEAVVDPRNLASVSLLEKNHFKREGLLRDYNYHNETFADAYMYSLLKKEYDQKTL